ncbi:MAG TPA: YARHG domain-containing protein [Chitinophagaceae bacterium]|jgi:YARHG domain|nr:YARHG domain-containing protein [Chitinophagaceae bacterium]
MKYFIIGIFFCFLAMNSYSQTPVYLFQGDIDSGDQLNPEDLHPWKPKQKVDYTGIYHFGESEWEWDLLVIIDDSVVVAQAFLNDWGKVDRTADETWRRREIVYRNVKCVQNMIASDSLTAYFMEYKTQQNKITGMILPYNSSKIDTAEFGGRTTKDIKQFWFFKGEYPELSWKIQNDTYFAIKSKEELQIMRNEIYARYGQRFAKNGKMYLHFYKKKWYQPFRDNVQSCLTEIEVRNLAKINAINNQAN